MILLIVLFSACSTNAPNSVTDAFNSMFPNATDIEWKMEEERQWEAEFTMDGVSYSSCFSESGDWLETEMAVGILDLPDTVLKVLEIIELWFTHYKGPGRLQSLGMEDREAALSIIGTSSAAFERVERAREAEQ